MSNLYTLFAVAVGLNVLLFIPAFIWRTDKLTDISYALTFAVLALWKWSGDWRNVELAISCSMVLVWAIRLGGFLLFRIWRMSTDKRFDGIREHFWKFFRFWLLQGISVAIILLPIGMLEPVRSFVPWYAVTGLIIFLIGVSVEAIADIQKYIFNNNPSNKGRWIETGLWRLSRHPNYLGEMMVWIGVYLYALASLHGAWKWLGLLSPLYIIGLLLFVSGIPLLEKSADARWGTDPAYQAYKKRIKVLIPFIF